MDRNYFDLNSGKFESVDTNLPLSEGNNIKDVKLEDIEKTLKNINLSYLNDNGELVENNNQEIIAPVDEVPNKLFDEPQIEDKLEFNMPSAFEESTPVENINEANAVEDIKQEENRLDFSPLINSMINEIPASDSFDNNKKINSVIETNNDSQTLIANIEKNRDIILAEINKINSEILIPAQEVGITNSDYLKESKAKSQIISTVSAEFENVINDFITKIKKNNIQSENAEELSAFRI